MGIEEIKKAKEEAKKTITRPSQKVAALLIALGPATASEILKNIKDEDLLEQITLDIANLGKVSDEAKRLVEVTKECLEVGKAAVRPWGHVGDIGAAIQEHAHKNGYTVVREFCGHGVGNGFHEDPYITHFGIKNTGMVLAPGMVFTIEPMINQGKATVFVDKKNGWTAYTSDGKLSAQWENTLMVTDHGIEVLAW